MADDKDIVSFRRAPKAIVLPPEDSPDFLKRVRELLTRHFSESAPLGDRVLTFRDANNAGAISVEAGGSTIPPGSLPGPVNPPVTPPTTIPDVPPSAPSGLVVTAGVLRAVLTWNEPDRAITAYTEIWRAQVDNLGLAVLVGTSVANVASDPLPSGGTFYYWIRHVGYSSNAVEGQKSAFNSLSGTAVTPAQIGTIDIGSRVVDVNKLASGQAGFYLNDDPALEDSSAWEWFFGDAGSIIAEPTVPFGARALAGPATVNNAWVRTRRTWAIDLTRIYLVRMLARGGSSSNRRTYLFAEFLDANGVHIDGSTSPSGWPSAGTYHYFGLLDEVPPLTWTEYRVTFGAGQAITIPSNARFMRLGAFVHYQGGAGGTAGQNFIAGVRCTEIVTAELVAANTIVAGSSIIANAAIGNAQIGLLAVDDARIASLDAAKINTGFLSANRVAAGSLDAKIAAITSAQITSLNANVINSGFVAAERIQVGASGGANIASNTAFYRTTTDFFGPNSGSRPLGWNLYGLGVFSARLDVNSGGPFNTNYVRVTWLTNINNAMGIYTRIGFDGIGGVREWMAGQSYVMSFWARAQAGSSALGGLMVPFNANHGWSETTTVLNPPLTTEWQRYIFIAVPSGAGPISLGEFFLSINVPSTTAPGSYDLAALQVEPGRLVTPWKPSGNTPGEISGVSIGNGEVRAANIFAGTITADRLAGGAVNDIFTFSNNVIKGDTPISLTADFFGVAGGPMDVISDVTYTPEIDAKIIVSVDAMVRHVVGPFQANTYNLQSALGLQITTTPVSDWTVHQMDVDDITFSPIGSGPSLSKNSRMRCLEIQNATAGVQYHVVLGLSKGFSANINVISSSTRRVRMVIQAVKR